MGVIFHLFNIQTDNRTGKKVFFIIGMTIMLICMAIMTYYTSVPDNRPVFFCNWIYYLGYQFSYNCIERIYLPKLIDYRGIRIYEAV
jgi:hypothetical protein